MATDSASILSLALQVLAARAVLLVTLVVTASLFGWAMWYHAWVPLAIAATFAVIVFLPVLWRIGENRAKDGS